MKTRMTVSNRSRSAFTLVELLVVSQLLESWWDCSYPLSKPPARQLDGCRAAIIYVNLVSHFTTTKVPIKSFRQVESACRRQSFFNNPGCR